MTTHEARMRLNAYSSGRRPDMTGPHLTIDLETASADQLFRRPDFVRLGGMRQDWFTRLTASGDEIVSEIRKAAAAGGVITGANICGFDLLALCRWHGLTLAELDGKIYDTQLAAYVFDPPSSGRDGVPVQPRGFYGLDDTCARFGVDGKSGDLKALARKYGGFDQIPADDPDYRDYLSHDLSASSALYTAMRATERGYQGYLAREMRVGLITASASLSGLRVDTGLLASKLAQQAEERAAAIAELAHTTGSPTTGANPCASAAGKAAIVQYLKDQGIREHSLPRTPKGAYSLGGDQLKELKERVVKYGGHAGIERVIDLVGTVVGMRTVYGTAESCRVGDRTHPRFMPRQSSGRWSVTDPGYTVFGKRDGKHVERRIVLPDEGHVLCAIDLRQGDARAVAALSQDPELMKIFIDGRDIFTELALSIFGDEKYRDMVKPISHGYNYGRSERAMVEDGIPAAVAAHFYREMRRKHPGITHWQEEARATASAGQFLDNGFGRPMRAEPQFAHTQAPALCGQGATRDMIAHGLLQMPVEYWPYIRLIVHDEIVVSVPEKDAEETTRDMHRRMEFDFRGVPITAERSPLSKNWGDCYEKAA